MPECTQRPTVSQPPIPKGDVGKVLDKLGVAVGKPWRITASVDPLSQGRGIADKSVGAEALAERCPAYPPNDIKTTRDTIVRPTVTLTTHAPTLRMAESATGVHRDCCKAAQRRTPSTDSQDAAPRPCVCAKPADHRMALCTTWLGIKVKGMCGGMMWGRAGVVAF